MFKAFYDSVVNIVNQFIVYPANGKKQRYELMKTAPYVN
uniref:Uncharacterized protein n=1 Tax=uncultured Desulfobacterium sp. TaxID=201089 RepID=E1YL67_9BACT|nr:unknown protein [uncultured Desulfobacterium sp.]